jgi:hypothetical protein
VSSLFSELRRPIVLVTRGRGREVYESSYALFRRLDEIPAVGDEVMSISEGREQTVNEAGVAALNFMLRTVGLRPFRRVCARRPGPERGKHTKWQWEFLGEYLGWNWHAL